MIDGLIGMFILGMGAVSFYALMPVMGRAHEIAQQESKAGQMASRIAEEFALLKPNEVHGPTLSALNLIDPGQADTGPWTVSHIPMDDGTDYSPAKQLRNGAGTVSTSNLAGGSILVKVQITWSSPSGAIRSYTTGTVIGGYR